MQRNHHWATACALLSLTAHSATGCVRGGFDPPSELDGRVVDSSDANSTHSDARGPVCYPWRGNWTFEEPVAVVELNSPGSEIEPFVTADGLRIYFSSDRGGGQGGWDIYWAERDVPSGPFGSARAYDTLNSADAETRLIWTADRRTAYLATKWPGGKGASDIWSAPLEGVTWPLKRSAFAPLEVVNTPANEWDPFPTADGLALYYDREDPESGEEDIYVVTRASVDEPFSNPRRADDLNSAVDEGNPWVSADGLLAVFTSSRGEGPGRGSIWYTQRDHKDDPFPTPQQLPVVSADALDKEPFLTADACTLYFSSDRSGGAGGLDLYRSRLIH